MGCKITSPICWFLLVKLCIGMIFRRHRSPQCVQGNMSRYRQHKLHRDVEGNVDIIGGDVKNRKLVEMSKYKIREEDVWHSKLVEMSKIQKSESRKYRILWDERMTHFEQLLKKMSFLLVLIKMLLFLSFHSKIFKNRVKFSNCIINNYYIDSLYWFAYNGLDRRRYRYKSTALPSL